MQAAPAGDDDYDEFYQFLDGYEHQSRGMRKTWLKSKEGDQNRCAVLRATKKGRKIGPFLDFRGRTRAPGGVSGAERRLMNGH